MAPEEAQGTAEATEEINDFLGTGPDGKVADDTPDDGGERAPQQAEAQETGEDVVTEPAEGEDTAGETPAPFSFGGREFATQEEAEKSYKEMQATFTDAQGSKSELERLRAFYDANVQQPAQAPPPRAEDVAKAGAKFLAMSPEQVIEHIDQGGYPALQEVVLASVRDSGVLDEVRTKAEQDAQDRILQVLSPALGVLAEVNDDREIAALEKKHGGAFTVLEDRVRELLKAPGNQLSARQLYAELAIERLDTLEAESAARKKGQQTKAGTAAAASAATRGSSKPGTAGAKPGASKGGGGELDDFFGADGTKGEAIPGTGLVELG